MLRSFPPVISPNIKILILGSFPGVASLAAAQYYAHPRNQFWQLLGMVIHEPLIEFSYAKKLKCILQHQIGLWDVLNRCDRKGSLDLSIRNEIPNEFSILKQQAPGLLKICFNGKTAARFESSALKMGYQTLVLPSSSPAHAALSFEKKLEKWRKIIE